MSVEKNRKLLLSVFNAIEQRNDQRFSELLHSDFEIHWPPSLPYGEGKSKTWTETWNPFQPTELERRMDPRVVAANEAEVLMEKCWVFINSARESSPAHKCSTLIRLRLLPFWPDP